MKLINNKHTQLLARAMDAYALRQKMTASNVANIDTPGYRRLSVSFEEELRQADNGLPKLRKVSEVNPKIIESDEKPVLEDELLEMADTQMRVQMVVRALRHNFELVRAGITGRNQ